MLSFKKKTIKKQPKWAIYINLFISMYLNTAWYSKPVTVLRSSRYWMSPTFTRVRQPLILNICFLLYIYRVNKNPLQSADLSDGKITLTVIIRACFFHQHLPFFLNDYLSMISQFFFSQGDKTLKSRNRLQTNTVLACCWRYAVHFTSFHSDCSLEGLNGY